MKFNYLKKLSCFLLLLGLLLFAENANAVVVTINATGTTGSYRTGSVSSAGVVNDGDMVTINSSSNRGFASFDLSTIPVGAVINSVSVAFTTFSSTSSSASNPIYGFTGDPSTMTGTALYANTASGTNFNSSSWTANALNTKTFNATGIAFIQNNIGSTFVDIGFVRGSTNTYNIYGYSAISTNQPALTIDYTAPTPCTGPISPITIASTTSNACVSTSFSITSSGVPVATGGIAYQWQSSPASVNTFVDVTSNGASANYTVVSQLAATDYRLRVICNNTNDTTYSNVLSIGQNPFYNCYCTPASTCTNEGIENVSFGTINNASTFCNNSTGYTDYSGLGSLATVTQAQAVLMTVSAHINSNPASAGVWIDYDHNGIFDASEFTSLGTATVTIPSGGTSYSFTGTVNISPTALTGITRMRVRSANQGGITANSACTNSGVYGEYEDYLITINAGTACAGSPTAGTVTGPTSTCPNSPFTLTVSGYSNGVTGLTYQWQFYNTVTSTWDPAPGTNNGLSYTSTSGISVATDYRFVITCSNGGGQDISNTLTVGMSSFLSCYCTPGTTSNTAGDQILNVTFVGINNSTGASGVNGYNDYTTSVAAAQVITGASYPISMLINNGGTEYGGVWIDWNQDGIFDASEFTDMGSGANPTVLNQTILVPTTALGGMTHMRVRSKYGSALAATDACAGYTYGETEDYSVNVTVAVLCSGTPSAGVAYGPTTVCANTPFTLNDSTYTIATGVTYQWQQYNTLTSTWDSIGNTPNFTVTAGQTTATDYRFVATCAYGGGQDISSTVTVGMSGFLVCYCSPLTGTTLSNYFYANYIQNVTIVGTTLNNTTTTVGTNGYSQFSPSTASATATLVPGLTYTINVGMYYPTYDYVNAWIDYDQSGTFDAGEQIILSSSSSGATGTFTVPLTATAGLTGFRVRCNDDGISTYSGSCINDYYGETEDYQVTIPVLTACSGTPAAVTASGPTGVCSGASFNLTATGMSIGTGITYQWQAYNTLTSTWDSIGNTPGFTVSAGQTVATDYRFVTTCANGGGQDISNTVSIGMNNFYDCYCSPLLGTTLSQYSGTNYITNVTIVGTNLNNTTTTPGPGGYTQYSPTVATNTAILVPGLTYTINVGMYYPNYDYVNAWIDYDQSGTFDAGEQIVLTSSSGGATGTFTVPLTASTGITGFRVRDNDDGISTYSGSCINDYYGETEDYIVTIPVLTSCSGTPSVATASGPTSVCPNVSFNLTATGMSIGSGITYQWQVYNTVTSTWDSVGNTSGLTVSGGLTVATDYRFVTTCTNSSATTISNTVTVGITPFYTCYCATVNAGGSGSMINEVDFGGLSNNSSASNPTGSPYYTYYNLTANVTSGASVPFSVTIDPSGTYSGAIVSVWIDFNHDGIYDASEWTQIGTNCSAGAVTTTNVQIPITALTGVTGMRVRSRGAGNQNGAGDACLNMGSGETEDYLVNIAAATGCTGTPSAGTAYGPSAACSGVAFNLNDSAYTVASGLTYQWQSSPAGLNTWSDISGANNPSLYTVANQTAATDYRLKDSCGNSNMVGYSNVVSVSQNAPTACYCIPGATNNGAGDQILNVTFGGINNSTGASGTNGYNDYTTTVSPAIINQGASPSFSMTINYGGTEYGGVWIDFDHSGTFDATEFTDMGSGSTSPSITLTQSILVPSTATLGNTRMRVRSKYGSALAATDACAGYTYGETEDYTVNITYPLAIKIVNISATNVETRNRVDWTTGSESNGDYFIVERSADGRNYKALGTVTAKGTASNYSYWDENPYGGINYYRLKMMDASGNSTYSKVVTATVKGNGAFTVDAYPNPVSNDLTVKVYGNAGNNAMVTITDVTGKVVKVVTVENNKATISMSELAAGMYLVKYTDDSHSQILKVNKK